MNYRAWIDWINGQAYLTVRDADDKTCFAEMGLPDDDVHGDYLVWAAWNDYEPQDPEEFLDFCETFVELEFEE